MARLDVHPMRGADDLYVLDVQAEVLSQLATRAVVPLLLESAAPQPIGELNPVFDIAGRLYVLVTQAIATVPARELAPAIASLAEHRDRVTRALDLLLVGF